MAKNHISNELESAGANVQYDEHVKRILANRTILAWILRDTVEELKEKTFDEIIESIGDDILISKTPLLPGRTNQPRTEAISTLGTEDKVPYEGMITFDLRFNLKIQNTELIQIKLLIDVEAQRNLYLSYAPETRGIFYGARMISAQLNTEFSKSNYQDLKKVYSIWICMNSPDYIGNTMTQYSIQKKDLIGVSPDNQNSYDLLTVLLIYLNENSDQQEPSLFHLLNVLLSPVMPISEKEKILEDVFHIPTKNEIGEELKIMCNLSETIEEMGIEKGIEKGIEQGLQIGITAYINICKDLGVSKDQTLQRLKDEFGLDDNKAHDALMTTWK